MNLALDLQGAVDDAAAPPVVVPGPRAAGPWDDDAFARGLRGYIAEVATAVGVGPESTTVDLDSPAGAYIALDRRPPRHPDRDAALLWDERHGWSAAIETHSGEDLIVLRYLGSALVPSPAAVAKAVATLYATPKSVRPLEPPRLAIPRATLIELLTPYCHQDLAFGRVA